MTDGVRHRLAIFASGRGSNLEAIMTAEGEGWLGLEIALVLSDQANAPALDLARARDVPTAVVEYPRREGREAFGESLSRACRDHQVTVIALAGFMRLLPENFLDQYPDRVFNIHPSLLPAFPGLRAQAQALEYGVKLSGCTVHLVDAGVDTGPVVMQASVPIYPGDDEAELAERILYWEHRLYPRDLASCARGRLRRDGRRVRILDA